MRAETFLKQGRLLDRRIEYHLRKLAELREAACSLPTSGFSGERVQTSRSGDAPFVRALMRVEEMQERINREIDRLAELKESILDMISLAGDEELRMVLIYKYLEGMTGEQIARKLHVDRSTVVRWHSKAINRIQTKLDSVQDDPDGKSGFN